MCVTFTSLPQKKTAYTPLPLFPPSHKLIQGHDDQQDRRNLSPQIMQVSRAVSLPHGPGRGVLPELLVCPIQVFTKLALDVTGKHRSQLQRDSLLHSVLQSSSSESVSLINLCNTYTFQNPTYVKMYITKDFLDGAADKKPLANAGDMDSIPGPGKFHTLWSDTAHAPQLWGPPSRAGEPLFLKPVRPEPMPATREAAAVRSACASAGEEPRSPQLEEARAQQRPKNQR